MTEQEKKLSLISFGSGSTHYYQDSRGLQKYTAKNNHFGSHTIGKLYIHQITIIRDIEDRYEPLYTIMYEDMVFDEIKTVHNKTFEDLVNFLDKQNLITENKGTIKFILSYAINFRCNETYDDVSFIVKQKVDFDKEELQRKII